MYTQVGGILGYIPPYVHPGRLPWWYIHPMYTQGGYHSGMHPMYTLRDTLGTLHGTPLGTPHGTPL